MSSSTAQAISNLAKRVRKQTPMVTPLSFGGNLILNIRTVTDDDEVSYEDHTILADPGAALTVTLPDPDFVGTVGSGFLLRVKKINASGFNVTIDAGAYLIDGSSTYVLSASNEGVILQSNQLSWYIVGVF